MLDNFLQILPEVIFAAAKITSGRICRKLSNIVAS